MGQITTTFTNEITSGKSINSFNGTYATARSGSNLGVNNLLNTVNGGTSYSYDGANYTFTRNWFHYDITSIPANATIISAFFRLPGTNTHNANTNTDTLTVVKSTVSSNDTLATSDWTNFDTTSFGTLAFASYNNAANNDITINATGIAYLQTVVAGHAKLAVVTSRDLSNSTPTGFNVETANYTGQILSITYSIPEATGVIFIN